MPKKDDDCKPAFQSPLERHPEHVHAIGMITIELANLEVALADLLGALVDIPREQSEEIYFTPNATIARLSIVENIVRLKVASDHPLRKKLDRILKKSREAMGKRHRLIHSAWLVKIETGEVVSASLPVRQGSYRPMPSNELHDLIALMRRTSTDAFGIAPLIHRDLYEQTT